MKCFIGGILASNGYCIVCIDNISFEIDLDR